MARDELRLLGGVAPDPSRPRGPRRRTVHWAAAALVALALGGLSSIDAAPVSRPALRVGVSLALTGPDAGWGVPILQGVQLAVEDVNRRGGAGGRVLETLELDSSALGLDGPSRRRGVVADYERFVADPAVIATVGPQTSAEARAVAVLLSRAALVTITPSATTFDITDPSLRNLFRPGGRTVFFRTIGTDIAQGDAMARFAYTRLGVRRVVMIHDGLEFGDRTIEAFARRAAELGITVLAHRLLDWIDQDYRPALQEIASLKPDALYCGVRFSVGVKLARQAPAVLPSVHLLATEALYNRALPFQARATGAEGWYVTNVGPDLAQSPATQAWAERYRARFGAEPSTYSLTAYTAVTVIANAVDRVAKSGRPITRATVRDAIQATRLPDALSGPVSFDPDGDLERAAISVYQVRGGAFRHVETIFTRSGMDGTKVGG